MNRLQGLLLLVFLSFSMLFQNVKAQHSGQSFSSYEVDVNGISFQIDPKIELFNIIAMQFGHSGMTISNIPYKQESLNYFSDYSDHHAPALLMETWQKGWYVDDPMFFLLHLDDDFTIKDNMPEEIIERAGGIEQLQKLTDAFREYAHVSGFYTYFNEVQKPFYEQILSQTAYNFGDFNAVEMLEDFYGAQANSYNLILNINSGYGNFGKSIVNDGSLDLYAIVETSVAIGDMPVYTPSVATMDLILHEFSHGFVNPVIDVFADQISTYDHLLSPIEESMRSQAYHHWHTVVNEHIVRANVILMAEQAWGETYARQMFYRNEMGKRYIYLDAILNRMEAYLKNRDKYTTFADYANELVSVFDGITDKYISDKQQKVQEIREPNISSIPKPYDITKDSSTVFVIGTHEPDKAAEKLMHDWVTSYRDMFSGDIQIITDDEALNKDLSNHDIVLFGTQEGNRFLKNHISDLPIAIDDEKIVTNKIIRGTNLQLVTSWVNPFNMEKTMVIYTAQQTADIQRFNYSMHKDQYHYWVAKDLITLEKGNYSNYYRIWMPDIF